jgi:maleylpyruvate isomerase
MTGSSTSPKTSVEHETVPAQRSSAERAALEHATTGMAMVREATERLYEEVSRLDDAQLAQPTLLPGWSKAHLVTHLARNADALVNLLTWARTGIEHPMYASKADRDADIEEGSHRLGQVIREDLLAASARLDAAAERLTGLDWQAPVAHRTGRVFPAGNVPSMRLFEVWVHMVDLDSGVTFKDIPELHLEMLIDTAVYPHVERTEGEPVEIRVELLGGDQRNWRLVVPGAASSAEISGSMTDMVAWLAGRSTGEGLTGPIPILPAWG